MRDWFRHRSTPPPSGHVGDRADVATPDEAALVERAKRDRLAFAPLYLRYLDPVHRYCYRRLGSREAAEDATALIFERALKALPAYRGDVFRAWLFTIAHNVVADCYRAGRPNAPLAAAAAVADPAPPPEEIAVLADERRLLLAALPLLPDDQRRVMELRLAGLPAVEVALVLGRSPEAVRAMQLRAVRRLQALLVTASAAKEVRGA